ncbi:ABC transporter substrate-binding protein [Blautia stercoris]|jgi:arabinosaccharide transport system substrate-binding protein|uniref:ABC transporter substrate-binding protein n=1 Tax=Blautia stercoris TaxID=871664 RepID=UPI004024B247
MKKKVLAALLCAAMVGTTLAGCGSSGSDSGSDDSAKQTGKKEMDVEGDDVTTLNVWTFIENHQDFYTDMAEKWNEENPDRKVKLVLSNMAYDDMHNKLSLALESGEGAPDVVDIELGKFPAFMTGNIGLKDLTDAIAPYKDNVVESRLDLYSKDGKYYGLPTHVGTTVAFYNTEELEAAGIDYTTIKTWDDFKEAGIKYHEATGKTFAAAETTAQWTLNLMLAQKGGSYLKEDGSLDVNNDKMVEVLQCMKDMQDAGALATIAGGQPDNEEAYPLYNSGDVAAAIMPFWQTSRYTSYMTDLSGKVAIAAPPVFGDNDAVKTIGGGGTGTAVVASGENADLAADVFAFIKLSDEANVEVWNVLGFDPVNTEVWTQTDITENPDNQYVKYFNTKPFDALLDVQDNIGLLDCYTDEKMPSINNVFTTQTLNDIFESDVDVKEALDEAQDTLENEFAE